MLNNCNYANNQTYNHLMTCLSARENLHTVWRCAVTGEDFLFRLVGIEKEQMVQITDPISQRADGEIFSSEGHQVPYHPFSCKMKQSQNMMDIVNFIHFCSV